MPGTNKEDETERRQGAAALLRTEQQTQAQVSQVQMDVAVMKEQIMGLRDDVKTLITRPEFAPVKLITYGLASSVGAAVLAAVLALVVRHQ